MEKRLLCLLMVLCMVFSLFPVSAFAEEQIAENKEKEPEEDLEEELEPEEEPEEKLELEEEAEGCRRCRRGRGCPGHGPACRHGYCACQRGRGSRDGDQYAEGYPDHNYPGHRCRGHCVGSLRAWQGFHAA